MSAGEFILYTVLGCAIVAPLYLLFVGALEWLQKRDDWRNAPINSYRAAAKRMEKSKEEGAEQNAG